MSGSQPGMRAYVGSYVALLALTGLTFGLSFADLGAGEWIAALGIAAAKSVIVALFFMHLIEMSASHRLAGVIAVSLLSTLILFALADVWTRSAQPGPEQPVPMAELEKKAGVVAEESGGAQAP